MNESETQEQKPFIKLTLSEEIVGTVTTQIESPLYLRPDTVLNATTRDYKGKTHVNTSAGSWLVQESPEEVLSAFGIPVEVDKETQ